MTIVEERTDVPQLGVDVIGFGAGEFAYLLNVSDGPARDRSVAVFRADEAAADEALATAGASSLLARGLATVRDGDLGVLGTAAAVATALGEATRWTEISLLTNDSMDNIVQLDSPSARLLLQPRMLGTWFAFAQDESLTGAAVTAELVREHVRQSPGGTAYVVVKTVSTEQHLLIRTAQGQWTTGIPDFDANDVAETAGQSFGQLVAEIGRLRGQA